VRAPMRFLGLALAAAALVAPLAVAADALGEAEALYGDWRDATYALATVRAGPAATVDGRDASAWEALRDARAAALAGRLPQLHHAQLARGDRAVLAAMENGLADAPTTPAAAAAGESAARCRTVADPSLARAALSQALYACFEHFGNHLAFEDGTITRTTALELLQQLDDTARRRAVFAAFAPLWATLEPGGAAVTPYRRLLRLAAAENAARGHSAISDAARTVGATERDIEAWLVAVLDRWRVATEGPAVEPWDYWYAHTRASRALDPAAGPGRIPALTRRYYRELGADLDALGVQHDLAVRPGKAPLAYAEFVRIGRVVDGRWRPAIARVSANVEHGGLFVLNEIVHEDGHAVHMAAVRARPAFFDLGDDLFVEAFADVTAWSVAEPAWQRRYLGHAVQPSGSLEALYASVMLDVAWGLFELRMLQAPDADPNAVWTAITQRYLHVVRHPELPWWALRVQLVHLPGYMINYGLGAVLTADLRQRTRRAIGPFDAGNPRWYAWTSRALLRYGNSLATPALLRRFLGRPVSTAALLAELDRIRPAAGASPVSAAP
jgi:hypothetical protein